MTVSTKINKMLQKLPNGLVLLSPWLVQQGYSYSLQQAYRQNGWLNSIGRGAMVRSGQPLKLIGALEALQTQAGLPVHIGGRTALGMTGHAHYLEVNKKEILLFTTRETYLPAWLHKNKWDSLPVVIRTSFLPDGTGLIDFEENGITIKISGPARAIMECLELAPRRFDLYEAWEIMHGLNSLQPEIVKKLLLQCNSFKVKRLFLYFAEKAGHDWLRKIKTEEIDLGKGKRSIVKGGEYVSTYMTTLPPDLV